MTQNVLDYSLNPSGNELMDDYLAGMAENQLTNHSGVSRPSYAKAGTFWIDTSTNPWVLKQFTGSADISVGTLNQSGQVFIASRALGDKNGNDITTKYVTVTGTAAKATADADGNTISSTYVKTTGTAAKATADADGNTISSTYAKLGSANTFTGKNTFTGQNQRPITIECPWTLGTPPASTTYRQIQFTDENGTATGGIEKAYYDSGSFRTQIVCLKQDGSSNYARIGVGWDESGNEYITASNGVRSGIANMSMPNYGSGVSKSSGTNYTETSNGFLYVEIHRSSGNSGTLNLKIGNTTLNIHSQDYDWNSCLFPIAKGVTYSLTLSGVALQKAVFYPCYGG